MAAVSFLALALFLGVVLAQSADDTVSVIKRISILSADDALFQVSVAVASKSPSPIDVYVTDMLPLEVELVRGGTVSEGGVEGELLGVLGSAVWTYDVKLTNVRSADGIVRFPASRVSYTHDGVDFVQLFTNSAFLPNKDGSAPKDEPLVPPDLDRWVDESEFGEFGDAAPPRPEDVAGKTAAEDTNEDMYEGFRIFLHPWSIRFAVLLGFFYLFVVYYTRVPAPKRRGAPAELLRKKRA